MAARVTHLVRVYEVDNKELPVGDRRDLVVESHWNSDKSVVLHIDGKAVTVGAKELQQAIVNCTNWRGY